VNKSSNHALRLHKFSNSVSQSDLIYESVSELYYDRRSVGQSVLVSSIHLGPTTRFLLLSDNCGFIDVGALSDERSGLSFTMYNVQYIYILHFILRYSFTNLTYRAHTLTYTLPHSLAYTHTHTVIVTRTHAHSHPHSSIRLCFPGGPVCYALTRKFEADRIQHMAQQTSEGAVISVLS
jgi:hypothetical protein